MIRALSDPPRVSVLICAYNAARTLTDCIASVQAQSVRDLDILVIDDGSTDESAGLVESIRGTDPRVRLIRQENAGVGVTRNRAVAESQAPVIAFLDADDRWHEEHLARHLASLAQDERIGVSFSRARFIDFDGRPTGESSSTPAGDVTPADTLSGNPCTTCSTMVIRREVFETVGGFRAELRHAEDQEWLLRVALSPYRLVCDGRQSVDYRTSPEGLSADIDAMLAGFTRVLASARQLAPDIAAMHAPGATARMLLYAARRSARLRHGITPALDYLTRALAASPRTVLTEPRRSIGVLIGLLRPKRHDTHRTFPTFSATGATKRTV